MFRAIRTVVIVGGVAALWGALSKAPEPTTGQADYGLPRNDAVAVAPPGAQDPPGQVLPSETELEQADGVVAGSVAYVAGSRVNLRAFPSLEGRSIGQLVKGSQVKVLSSVDGWSQIETSLGTGWMASRFLAPNAPDVAQIAVPKTRAVAAPSSREIQAAMDEIIRQSIASYPGSCPCPFNTDRAGRRCGGRSAWSKPGGYSPICYDSDISQERLDTYFARKRGAAN